MEPNAAPRLAETSPMGQKGFWALDLPVVAQHQRVRTVHPVRSAHPALPRARRAQPALGGPRLHPARNCTRADARGEPRTCLARRGAATRMRRGALLRERPGRRRAEALRVFVRLRPDLAAPSTHTRATSVHAVPWTTDLYGRRRRACTRGHDRPHDRRSRHPSTKLPLTRAAAGRAEAGSTPYRPTAMIDCGGGIIRQVPVS